MRGGERSGDCAGGRANSRLRTNLKSRHERPGPRNRNKKQRGTNQGEVLPVLSNREGDWSTLGGSDHRSTGKFRACTGECLLHSRSTPDVRADAIWGFEGVRGRSGEMERSSDCEGSVEICELKL